MFPSSSSSSVVVVARAICICDTTRHGALACNVKRSQSRGPRVVAYYQNPKYEKCKITSLRFATKKRKKKSDDDDDETVLERVNIFVLSLFFSSYYYKKAKRRSGESGYTR